MPSLESKDSQTILSIDFGTKKLGVAVGETLIKKAFPLGVINVKDDNLHLTTLDKYISEWKPSLIVVGYPLGIDGKKNKMTKLVEEFAKAIKDRYQINYEFVDERYSSFEARQLLNTKNKKEKYDNLSATIILEYWFDTKNER